MIPQEQFFHNNRLIKVEFDKNMLIAMNLPVHIARERIREAMPANAVLPMEEWTISHWRQRVRVTSFADLSYEDERTTISTSKMELRRVIVDSSVAPASDLENFN